LRERGVLRENGPTLRMHGKGSRPTESRAHYLVVALIPQGIERKRGFEGKWPNSQDAWKR
jgi:hypothetical protein